MSKPTASPDRSASAWFACVFLVCVVLYALTSYGGIRSPDNEIVFRAAESLGDHGLLDVPHALEDWDGFGLARAKDGRDYPIFGPVQSIALAPFVAIGRVVVRGWKPGAPVPASYSVSGGLASAWDGTAVENWPAHALRLFCSSFNVIVGGLSVAIFFGCLLRLTGSLAAAFGGSCFLAVGSLFWPYTGTFFSEPLATLFLLICFRWMLELSPDEANAGRVYRGPALADALLAGAALGASVATHLSALLYVPFFLGFIAWSLRWSKEKQARARLLSFCGGLAAALGMLGLYNWSRFGNVFETGRTVDPKAVELFHYGVFTQPWRGLYGLSISPGKGLLLFSPAILIAFLAWPRFHRRHSALSWMIATTALIRWVTLAARSDWHGGFCLGPRYLVTLLPFLLLPSAVLIEDAWRRGDRRTLLALGVALFLCVAQQAALSLGEVFTFLHRARFEGQQVGIDVFTNDHIYLDWQWSPLRRPMDGPLGPFLLGRLGWSKPAQWLTLMALVSTTLLVGVRALSRQHSRR